MSPLRSARATTTLAVTTLLLAACGGPEELDSRHPGIDSSAQEDLSSRAVKCPGSTVLQGIDVSHWDGTIDWAKVEA